MKKKLLIPVFLAALAVPLALRSEPIGLSADFIGEYTDSTAYKAYGSAVNHQMADEGFVLLKNDGMLPMEPGMATLAGKSAYSIARGGAGSGRSSPSSGIDAYDLEKSLTKVGFEVNPVLKAFYADNSKSGIGRTNDNDGWKGNSQVQIGETPINLYGDDELASMDDYNDVAFQVLTREGSEGCDVKTVDARDFDPRNTDRNGNNANTPEDSITKKHALELSDNEEDLLEELKAHFDKVIIVINSSNIFECDELEKDPQVGAIIWIGNPGDVGPAALGRIVTGEVNPSGRTVDTWARSFREDPTFQNFSDNAQTNDDVFHSSAGSHGGADTYAPQDTMFNADGTPTRSYGTDKNYKDTASPRWADQNAKVVSSGINGVRPSAYVSYEEGIYVDYRYYETRYADMAKEDKEAADEWYDGEKGVVYPFGYGLSYTTFDQNIIRVRPSKGATLDDKTDLIEVTVKVTNTGDVAGKDAVQLYWKAPYIKGEIEKADHVLCAFDKTNLLEPGESQIMQLTFHLQDVANYDFSDANNNEFAGYELDAGEYAILLGKNAHEAYGEVKLNVIDGGIKYENDRFTGHKVENRFTNRGFYNCMPEGDLEFTQMSRADFEGTFPTHPTIEDRTLSADSRFEEFLTHEFSVAELDQGNFEYVPEAAYRSEEDAIAEGWAQNGDYPISLAQMKDVDWDDDQKWNEFLNGFSWSDMLKFTELNKMSSPALNAIGKNGGSEGDGPQKFSIMQWVSSPIIAATFNPKLAHKQGECVGMESRINGKSGWWGPAVNTHRSPFGGRNFEYYSADPFLMGRIAAEVVGAATDRGVYAYFKHFAVNDQEKNRESGISFLNEQALREIYLKSFQMVFEEGKSIGVMGSYNRLGLMETAASYPLLTEVLRGEWGFKGAVLSDMTHSGNSSVNFKCYENVNNRVLAGCNSQLDQGQGFGGNSEAKWDSTLKAPAYTKGGVKTVSYSYWNATRQMIKGIMYMFIRCTNGNPNNSNFTSVVNYGDSSNPIFEKEYTYKIGEDIDIDIELPNNEAADSMRINQRVDLPKGLSFAGNNLSGKIEEVGLYRIDVIANVGSTRKAVKVVINIVPDEAEYNEDLMDRYGDDPVGPVGPGGDDSSNPGGESSNPGGSSSESKPAKKGGCGGTIAATSALIALVAIAAVGAMLLSKKRKVSE